MKEIAHLHLITIETGAFSEKEQVEQACAAGARWIQLRLKNKEESEALQIAQEVREITRDAGTKLIINDRLDLMMQVKADGIHVGAQDLHPQIVRNVIGSQKILGATVNNVEMAQWITALGVVDYVGVGPYHHTSTKENLAPLLSEEEFLEIKMILKEIPALVIGGITPSDLPVLSQFGFHGIAVASGVFGQAEIARAYHYYCKGLENV